MNPARRILWNLSDDRTWIGVVLGAVGSALAAGTLPEIVKLLPGGNATLVATFLIGCFLLLATWLTLRRRSGIGIAIFLKPDPAANWSEAGVLEAAKEARQEHVSFFYINVDALKSNLHGAERFELARRVIEARLREEGDRRTVRLSFYLTCNLPNSFQLGQEIFHQATPNPSGRADIHAFHTIDVHQIPVHASQPRLPPLALEGITSPVSAGLQVPSALLPATMHAGIQANASTGRYALIIRIADRPSMVAQALAAADVAPGVPHGYGVAQTDKCAEALVIESAQPTFPNDQTQYNHALQYILQEWQRFIATRPATSMATAEGRLFIAAPNSLAFSLGALLPTSIRIIEHP